MSQELQYIQQQLKKFNVTDTAIAQMNDEFSVLKIAHIGDKEGYEAVKEARLTVRRYRIHVEKKRKELTADALKYQRAVNEEAKRITEQLEPIELNLSAQESAYDAEKERIKKEKLADLERERKEQIERDRLEQEAILETKRLEIEAEAEKIRVAQEEERARLAAIAEQQRIAQENIDRKLKEIAEKERDDDIAEQQRIAKISFDLDRITNEVQSKDDHDRERLINEEDNPGSYHDPLVTGTEFIDHGIFENEITEDIPSPLVVSEKEFCIDLYIKGKYRVKLLAESEKQAIEKAKNLLFEIPDIDVDIVDEEAY